MNGTKTNYNFILDVFSFSIIIHRKIENFTILYSTAHGNQGINSRLGITMFDE